MTQGRELYQITMTQGEVCLIQMALTLAAAVRANQPSSIDLMSDQVKTHMDWQEFEDLNAKLRLAIDAMPRGTPYD